MKAPLHARVFRVYSSGLSGTEKGEHGTYTTGDQHLELSQWLSNELKNGYILKERTALDDGSLRVITEYNPEETANHPSMSTIPK